MRELKFRAWNGSSMTVVGVGYLGVAISYGFKPVEWIDSKEWPVMQYTGLKDKNSIEIYEGDIYHQGDINIKYKVIFKDGQFVGGQVGNKSTVGLFYWLDRVEVIGNIHENPELLNKAKP